MWLASCLYWLALLQSISSVAAGSAPRCLAERCRALLFLHLCSQSTQDSFREPRGGHWVWTGGLPWGQLKWLDGHLKRWCAEESHSAILLRAGFGSRENIWREMSSQGCVCNFQHNRKTLNHRVLICRFSLDALLSTPSFLSWLCGGRQLCRQPH